MLFAGTPWLRSTLAQDAEAVRILAVAFKRMDGRTS